MDLTNHNDHDPFTLHGDAASPDTAPSGPARAEEISQQGAPMGAQPPAEPPEPERPAPEPSTPKVAPSQPGTPGSATPNPFDPAQLRLSQDFVASLGVKKQLLNVPVRKPAREWWVRVHPDELYRLETAVIELKEERETYLVAPDLWPELAAEATFSPRLLATAVNRQGVVFLWPVRLPGPDGKIDDWNQSAIEAVDLGTQRWIRVTANMSLGAYDVYEATADLSEPNWPELPLSDLLKIAFKSRYIDDLDHPVLRQLRGEA